MTSPPPQAEAPLVEKIARAICRQMPPQSCIMDDEPDRPKCTFKNCNSMLAAHAVARLAVEECARQVAWYAEEYAEANVEWETGGTSGREFFTNMAAAIRALVEPGEPR